MTNKIALINKELHEKLLLDEDYEEKQNYKLQFVKGKR